MQSPSTRTQDRKVAHELVDTPRMRKPNRLLLDRLTPWFEVVVALNAAMREYAPPERAWQYVLGGIVLEGTLAALQRQQAARE